MSKIWFAEYGGGVGHHCSGLKVLEDFMDSVKLMSLPYLSSSKDPICDCDL